jgi:hypothetical protein
MRHSWAILFGAQKVHLPSYTAAATTASQLFRILITGNPKARPRNMTSISLNIATGINCW